MNILGVDCYLHDSSAAMMINGAVTGCVEEERLSREKYTNKFPEQAINWCLKNSGITFEELDAIGFAWKPFDEVIYGTKHFLKYFPETLNAFKPGATVTPIVKRIKNNFLLKNDFYRFFGEIVKNKKIYYINHHLAHAANAFFSSPFEDAAVVVFDGLGDNFDTVTLWQARGKILKKIKHIKFPHSIGILYYALSFYLGFQAFSGPGKVMGLSSYGTPKYVEGFRELFKLEKNGSFKLNLKELKIHVNGNNSTTSKTFQRKYGKPREKYEKLEQHHADIAFGLQKITEEIILHICQYSKAVTGTQNLCIAGGVGLNCVANGLISSSGLFKRVFVSSAPHDGGTSLGAAQYLSHSHFKLNRHNKGNYVMPYLGPEFSEKEIQHLLKQYEDKVEFIRTEEPAAEAAKLIEKGYIMGWFQGAMEFGPRALGNRSIVADPRRGEMKDIINKKVKFREEFRPFAPSVMEEFADEYFENPTESPFMSFAFRVKEEKQTVIPAVTHVDGTARIQTVEKKQNPLYYKLIEEFYKLTKVPLILNTSLNIKGEPLCCSPQDAVSCLIKTEMDYLTIGNFIVKKGREISS